MDKNIPGISEVFVDRTKGVYVSGTWLQNETFRKSATSELVRMVLHPLIDLEQLAVVLVVCTRMRKEKIPALSVCLCGSPD